MSIQDHTGVSSSGTTDESADDRIVGPITEFDRYGEPTGEQYFECAECGQPAMYRSDLDDCCPAAEASA